MKAVTVTKEFVDRVMPKRDENGHKGDFGRVYVLAGSVGLTGAPTFTAKAAVRSGAGLVYLGVPEKIYTIEAVKNDEVMVSPLHCFEDGMLSELSVPSILDAANTNDVLAVGPGLGRGDGVKSAVLSLLCRSDKPTVLDADGLFAVKDDKALLTNRTALTIITPHEGEFERLGYGGDEATRQERALKAAAELNCIVVLKGHKTVTAFSDGRCFINTSGNSGMAKGGSGDVLTGIIAALIGQKIPPEDAVPAAVWIHGAAGDAAKEKRGEYAVTPCDILDCISDVLKEY